MEDLYGEPRFPTDTATPYRVALKLSKGILRNEYKVLAAEEPELACGCPGWWEVPSERKYAEQIRNERYMRSNATKS
jgi:hypothetical protein